MTLYGLRVDCFSRFIGKETVEALVRAAEEHFGRIDIMVNLVHNPELLLPHLWL